MTEMGLARKPRCPVCQASFRGEETCSRCGADLFGLMLLAAHAYRFREMAREGLLVGDAAAALAAAREAQSLHATEYGALLMLVCQATVETL